MSRDRKQWERALEESLRRVDEALGKPPLPSAPIAPVAPTAVEAEEPQERRGSPFNFLTLAGVVMLVLAATTGPWWLVFPALGVGSAGLSAGRRRRGKRDRKARREARRAARRERHRAHVGMGASIASDAVIEPGASVEMGATVRPGAVVKSGAVVKMGATVGRGARIEGGASVEWGATVGDGAVVESGARIDWGATVGDEAVVESGAVVGWGVSVHDRARVGSRAVVSAGASVMAGARVEEGARIHPGATVWASEESAARPRPAQTSATPAPAQKAAPQRDPREVRVDEVCDRLERELREAPERVREFLGTSDTTVQALQRTCHDLLRRERALKSESSPEVLARLDQEKGSLEQRLASEQDEVIRRSLQGAVGAIAEQRRQRELLARNAARLDAEQTRLVWTLESMAAQLVRLRAAGDAAGQVQDAELERSVGQLRDEIDAIADALGHVAEGDRVLPREYAEAPATAPSEEESRTRSGVRGRD